MRIRGFSDSKKGLALEKMALRLLFVGGLLLTGTVARALEIIPVGGGLSAEGYALRGCLNEIGPWVTTSESPQAFLQLMVGGKNPGYGARSELIARIKIVRWTNQPTFLDWATGTFWVKWMSPDHIRAQCGDSYVYAHEYGQSVMYSWYLNSDLGLPTGSVLLEESMTFADLTRERIEQFAGRVREHLKPIRSQILSHTVSAIPKALLTTYTCDSLVGCFALVTAKSYKMKPQMIENLTRPMDDVSLSLLMQGPLPTY